MNEQQAITQADELTRYQQLVEQAERDIEYHEDFAAYHAERAALYRELKSELENAAKASRQQ